MFLQERKSSMVGEIKPFVGINGASCLEHSIQQIPRKESEISLALMDCPTEKKAEAS